MKRLRQTFLAVSLLAGLAACAASIPTTPQPATVAPVPSSGSSTAAPTTLERPSPEDRIASPACAVAIDLTGLSDRAELDTRLKSLQDACGGAGLVGALDAIDRSDREREFNQAAAVFTMIRSLGDPRAAESLVRYIETQPAVHWRTEAAFALAELGDCRAAPALAERLRLDPIKLYADSDLAQEQALARDDTERVVAARLLSDLAVLHPDRRPWLLDQAEQSVLGWLDGRPAPHANGLRFLATAGSAKALPKLRAWALPNGTLPRQGQQPPMPEEWVVAEVALRYLGRTRDASSWSRFEAQLHRRQTEAGNVDVTMPSLMGGGLALLGMSVRALGVGVADGYAEWGAPRAYPVLVRYIEDGLENELARLEACFALGWVTPDDKAGEVATKAAKLARSSDPASEFLASCYAESLARRPAFKGADLLIPLIAPSTGSALRSALAAAIGRAGLTAPQAAKLQAQLTNNDQSVAVDAAVALLLGGSLADASSVVPTLRRLSPDRVAQLRDTYPRALATWTDEDLSSGRMDRWARNAEAASAARAGGQDESWVSEAFSRALADLRYDQGPRSLTAVVMRFRLMELAKQTETTVSAIRLLRMAKATGVLMALRDVPGTIGANAGDALRRLQGQGGS